MKIIIIESKKEVDTHPTFALRLIKSGKAIISKSTESVSSYSVDTTEKIIIPEIIKNEGIKKKPGRKPKSKL